MKLRRTKPVNQAAAEVRRDHKARPARTCKVCMRVTDELDSQGRCTDRVICEGRMPPLIRTD